ncbi:MAG: aldolase/citrate lyase family protein [Caldilineaceae bacterium]
MRGNRVKQKLAAGEVATVLSGHSISSHTIDFCGQLGFDGFWIEGEHGSVTWAQIGDLSRACDLWDIASVMRIHSREPGIITRTLDLGVNGLVVPHVNSKAEAEAVMRAARFGPIGQRGMFQGRRAYGDADFFAQANDEILLVVLIEELRAVEQLAAILTVDHIDVFFVAPSDLAQTMGYVGQPYHPAVQEVVAGALRQIVAAGRTAGSLSAESTLARDLDLGARFFLTSYDPWLKAGAQAYLANLAALRA